MIPRIVSSTQPAAWQRALAEAITDPAELLQSLGLDPALLSAALSGHGDFPIKVPRSYLARMRHGDPQDPLLRQVLPISAESDRLPGFVPDPVGDLDAMAAPGVLHKYTGRVLLIATGACAVHCRYCFRRHFPYTEANAATAHWQASLDYIASRDEIEEVILSGGDPLVLSDGRLGRLIDGLGRIPHLRRLRIHTRLPVVLPERVDEDLISRLADTPLSTVMVIHANHAREIDETVREALKRLGMAGVSLLNQAVLLRGVNDSAETQFELGSALVDAGVMPYYLHLLDRVQGAAHFEVPEDEARKMLRQLMAMAPGYLVPRLVREEAGHANKTPVPY